MPSGADRADVELKVPDGTPPDVRAELESLFEAFVELDVEVWRFRERLRRTVRRLKWRA